MPVYNWDGFKLYFCPAGRKNIVFLCFGRLGRTGLPRLGRWGLAILYRYDCPSARLALKASPPYIFSVGEQSLAGPRLGDQPPRPPAVAISAAPEMSNDRGLTPDKLLKVGSEQSRELSLPRLRLWPPLQKLLRYRPNERSDNFSPQP